MKRQPLVPGGSSGGEGRIRDPRPAPMRAGRVRALREAIDDALSVLVFVRTGLVGGAIDPSRALWVVDLAPADGERAWRVLGEIAARGPRGPMIRYLACCRDAAHRATLSAHPSLRPLLADGRLVIDDEARWLGLAAPRNPVVVLAHEAFSTRAQHAYRPWRGGLQEAGVDEDGASVWRAPERRDGPVRLLATCAAWPETSLLTLPFGAMQTLSALLELSEGRLLLRGSDLGIADADAIRDGALGQSDAIPDPRGRMAVNFDALARWHRATGGSVQQSQRSARGRVLHLALHDREQGRLRDCLPDLLELPHPDDHLQLLRALQGMRAVPAAQCLSLLHTAQGDPRALAALSRHLIGSLGALDSAARGQWREMLARCRRQHFPRSGVVVDGLRVALDLLDGCAAGDPVPGGDRP